MTAKTKKIIKIVAVLFIAVVGTFYVFKLRSGGKKASQFVSLTYKWGVGDTLQNSYSSKTGNYQFLDHQDRLIKESFRLRINNIIYLHSKIAEQDLLSIPDTVANVGANLKDAKVLRYEIELVYDNSTRNIVYLTNYDKDQAIASKASTLQKTIQQVITEAEERYSNR